ncbi:MAG: DUF4153 domain-containing protein [Sphingomonas sp.]|nr:DUF4153 domain-containing protein [Sphingomonas sp.]
MSEAAVDQSVGAHDAASRVDGGHWPLRPVMLVAICGLSALVIQQLVDSRGVIVPVERVALALAIAAAATAFALVVERVRLGWAIGFALGLGGVAGAIYYWHGSPGGSDFWPWRGTSLLLGLGVLIPLFQAARDAGRWRFAYPALHGHAWTDAVIGVAANVFVGIVFLMSWLLALLFKLIKIDALEKLLEKHWFAALLFGAAFGGAIGLLRERDKIVRLLQRVVTAVLGVLAPVLGIGLLLFLLSLPFTGLAPLWEATRSATPILLSCVIGALLLANAVLGNGTDDEARNPVLRYGAMALGLAMLPLVAIAAVATGLRIDQHGFTPQRLWGLTFVVIASAYGLAYLVSLARGRAAWAPLVRSSNTLLAFGVAAVALFLATPILSFNAISTADQVARLTAGKVKPEKFDWAALAFDFGAPGRAALTRLTRSANATTAERARAAMKAHGRWDVASIEAVEDGAEALAKRIRIQPREVPLPDGLLLSFEADAYDTGTAVLWYEPGSTSAVLVTNGCDQCQPSVAVTHRDAKGVWRTDDARAIDDVEGVVDDNTALKDALAKRGFEIRPIPRRQVYIDGKPVGVPFE